MPNKIIPYKPELRELARKLRKNMTYPERVVWENIKGKRSGWEFHRQVPLLKYIVDFYCHELKLAVEIDGESHEDGRGAEADLQRDAALEKYGVKTVRFGNGEVLGNVGAVVEAIYGAVEERVEELGPA